MTNIDASRGKMWKKGLLYMKSIISIGLKE
jgi:hypothetical protein